MRKRFLSLLLMMALLLSACGGKAKNTNISDTAVTFTDDLGREVTVDDPQRVAVLLGSFAQIWQLAGGTVVATPEDAWKDLNLQLPDDTVNLGHTKRLSLELLFASQPDFILASTNTRQNVEWQETLEGTTIPVAYFDVDNFDDYLRIEVHSRMASDTASFRVAVPVLTEMTSAPSSRIRYTFRA